MSLHWAFSCSHGKLGIDAHGSSASAPRYRTSAVDGAVAGRVGLSAGRASRLALQLRE